MHKFDILKNKILLLKRRFIIRTTIFSLIILFLTLIGSVMLLCNFTFEQLIYNLVIFYIFLSPIAFILQEKLEKRKASIKLSKVPLSYNFPDELAYHFLKSHLIKREIRLKSFFTAQDEGQAEEGENLQYLRSFSGTTETDREIVGAYQ